MSMLDAFLRFVDPIYLIERTIENRRKKESLPDEVDEDDLDQPIPPRVEPERSPLVCRVCKYQGGPAHRYCPRCLAETMEEPPRPRRRWL